MNRRTFLRSVAAASSVAVGCWRPAPERPAPVQAERLLDLMNRRLALMLDVARAKWNTKSAVEDPAREQSLLTAVAEAGREFGLDLADTKAFFAAQIEASKMVQRASVREWEAERRGPFPDAPDLIRDLRPKIDAVGRELLASLADFNNSGRIPTEELQQLAIARLAGPGVTAEVRAVAVKPLERR